MTLEGNMEGHTVKGKMGTNTSKGNMHGIQFKMLNLMPCEEFHAIILAENFMQ